MSTVIIWVTELERLVLLETSASSEFFNKEICIFKHTYVSKTDQKTNIYCFFYKCTYKQQLYIVIMLKIVPKAWHWEAL